jgi:pyruvate/2-oxoglutarate dehydrogenase complex dihydrolipoamide dehydrogenase (E3) component
MNAPIIRLEIEGMKHTVMHAMTQYMYQMDADIKDAIERACRPEIILALIEKTARQEIEKAVVNEVEAFYRYGEGHAVIRDVVMASMLKAREA